MTTAKSDAHWQIQEAKQRFSELIRSVQADGPQFVTKHGEEIAVVIDIEEYNRLHGAHGPKKTFKSWLLNGPTLDDETIELMNDRPKNYVSEEDVRFFMELDLGEE
ncbi:MAG TPA: type II toxin-antitoxin system Phd/YefM family antitoxin [Actinocrinis sp.]|uniref:type II toxin-antitoxin system Phd/YefM family antitoxin n=1 Tax=Actinocrinis sp. TaxID=1920516 RepID=UPI002D6285D5|nr:type II toxin-antitoxin system Phd/YefM family antitoxin [Actinocrinis sp.]HZU58932.1 type II toxin-antitoxin system Phd/YefM family antitoxin [Actinocrinis sp.]